jgi:hypothetical protein
MIKHCPRCGNAVEMKTLDTVSGGEAPLKLTATGMPAAKCAKGPGAERARASAAGRRSSTSRRRSQL